MRWSLSILVCALGIGLSISAYSQKKFLAPAAVPKGLGVNIHFIEPGDGVLEMLSQTGVGWIRMDFIWELTERKKGIYDFSRYDVLVQNLEEFGIKAMFILDYGNPLYDQGLPPHSPEGRKAYARWAAAAVKHFSGKGYLWEIWNEPNINRFWKPQPDVDQYIRLAQAATREILKEAPGELITGPATSKIPQEYLKKIIQSGLLNQWAGITVHPYRSAFMPPETVTTSYLKLKKLLRENSPLGERIPILSGEWGYPSNPFGMNEEKQGKYLARMWLINMANGIPLSIWYDWRNDGPDPKNSEQNFGMVRHSYHEGRSPVFDAKPAFGAAKTLTASLKGYTFFKRLNIGGPRDYILAFKKGSEIRLAAWSSSPLRRQLKIPASPGKFKVINFTGEKTRTLEGKRNYLTLKLSDGPQYIIPQGFNERLSRLAGP